MTLWYRGLTRLHYAVNPARRDVYRNRAPKAVMFSGSGDFWPVDGSHGSTAPTSNRHFGVLWNDEMNFRQNGFWQQQPTRSCLLLVCCGRTVACFHARWSSWPHETKAVINKHTRRLLYWLPSVVAAPLHLGTVVLQTPRQPFKFIFWTSCRLTSATL